MKRTKVDLTIVALLLSLIGLSCSRVLGPSQRDAGERKDTVELPANIDVGDAEVEWDLGTDRAMILTLASDNKLYRTQSVNSAGKAEQKESLITKEEVPVLLKLFFADKTPDKQILYFKADVEASFANVAEVFDAVRKANIDRVALVVLSNEMKGDADKQTPIAFPIRLLEGPKELKDEVKPNPLTLVVGVRADGKLTLNNDATGTVENTSDLERRLRDVFNEREKNGVWRIGTNEVEKTVFLKAAIANNYGDLVRVVHALRKAGSSPIGIQIDDLVEIRK